MILVIGKHGKTENVLKKFLDSDSSYFITDGASLYGIKAITEQKLNRAFPEEKEKDFFYVTECNLDKVNNLVINNKMRNKTLIIDCNMLLAKYTLKEVRDFEFMNNLNVIITYSSLKENEIKEINI